MRPRYRAQGRLYAGYTLIELLVVMLIILLLSAAAIPAIMPAIADQKVAQAAGVLYGELTKAHDDAVRSNEPRGIRLIPDQTFIMGTVQSLTSSRLIAIEPGPDYSEGTVQRYFQPVPLSSTPPQTYPPPLSVPRFPQYQINGGVIPNDPLVYPYLVLHESKWTLIDTGGTPIAVPKASTMWFNNVRQGDKIILGDSGKTYTIAGPVTNPTIGYRPFGTVADPSDTSYTNPYPNPQRFISFGPPGMYLSTPVPGNYAFEFLFLTDGTDNDGDGYVDEGFDGIDNDGDGIIDPGFNGRDDNGDGFIDEWQEMYLHANGPAGTGPFIFPGCPDPGYPGAGGTPPFGNEFEQEVFAGTPIFAADPNEPDVTYVIKRRPVPTRGAREVTLPTDTLIDLTAWNTTGERSRLPVDPYTGYVDVLISPNGRVVQLSANANPSPPLALPFLHFWIAENEDVYAPQAPTITGQAVTLPVVREGIPSDARNLPSYYPTDWPTLKRPRRLISVNSQTGQILTNPIEEFDPTNVFFPYQSAQAGKQ
jgi:prepilin-type N-terminal cleavage/methylation domain-containing protein